ncbi:MAG: hypothetical protein WCV67_20200 [Victivallaceae bacterium]
MDKDYKFVHLCGILLLVISVFLLFGWADSYLKYLYYGPSSGSKHEFDYRMSCIVVFLYAIFIIGFSCLLSLPFYIYLVGYNLGKKVYIYIYLCTVVVDILFQTCVTSNLCQRIAFAGIFPNTTFTLDIAVNFLYFVVSFFLIALFSPSSNLWKMIKSRST